MVLALDLKEFHLLNYFKSLNWQMLIKVGLKHKLLEFSIFFSDLADENRSMKNYIDRLMTILMEKFPEVLENLGSSVHWVCTSQEKIKYFFTKNI